MAKFDIGDKVKHKVFGEGTIVDIAEGNSANLTIIFEDGKKVIKSSFVKLLAELDNHSQSYILNKMIDTFRERGCFTIEQIN